MSADFIDFNSSFHRVSVAEDICCRVCTENGVSLLNNGDVGRRCGRQSFGRFW